jgi:murein DD-endopeptidase MepM/ murein hydrolase activator NlpD
MGYSRFCISRGRRLRRSTVVVLISVLASVLMSVNGAALAAEVVIYQPPVSGAVVDGWRPPAGPYGAGNRGIDYATTIGQTVGAPAVGVVSFAGSVAGNKWVVIRHPDGRKSSLGPLLVISVASGSTLGIGQTIGTAAQTAIHWGVREANAYIDPGTLLPGPMGKLRLTG